jgi:hypothetical protein
LRHLGRNDILLRSELLENSEWSRNVKEINRDDLAETPLHNCQTCTAWNGCSLLITHSAIHLLENRVGWCTLQKQNDLG